MDNYLRGHKIEKLNSEWVYSDTKEPTAYNERDCGFCGMNNTKDGHDGCLGTLPGLMNACCGHGELNTAYVQFLDNKIISGQDSIKIIEILKRNINIKN